MTKRKTNPTPDIKSTPERPLPRRFAAIDFETADYGRDSACAVSVVRVEDGTIAGTITHLIRPPRSRIVFEYLHGISWEHVCDKPVFADLWPEVAPMLEGVDFVAAHNASFDRSVLRACCATAGHSMPSADFVCTVKLARQAWDIFPTKLSDVCNKFRIPLRHHDAASDALACAKIVLRAMEEGFDVFSLLKPKAKTRKKKA